MILYSLPLTITHLLTHKLSAPLYVELNFVHALLKLIISELGPNFGFPRHVSSVAISHDHGPGEHLCEGTYFQLFNYNSKT